MSDGDVQKVLRSTKKEGSKWEEFKEGFVKELALKLDLKGWLGVREAKRMALCITVHRVAWKVSEKEETHKWAWSIQD